MTDITAQPQILLVDDETMTLQSFRVSLQLAGYTNLQLCSDSREVMLFLEQNPTDLVVLDLLMPYVKGDELLVQIKAEHPELPVIMITGIDEVETAVRMIHQGAFDYLSKPVERDRLINTVQRALEVNELRRENEELRRALFEGQVRKPDAFANIITSSPTMLAIFSYCEAIAKGSHPILVSGETGVGKELIPRALHTLSGRKGRFVAINTAGLDENTFSDTLFGHIKGAFTGAASDRAGLIEQAAGGTLFLDEIGDLSPALQVKLLRLLEQREYFPLGADTPSTSDARVIVATHRDLHDEVKNGTYRQDLLYRLSTHEISVPPLRERPEDIPLLLEHYIREAAVEFGRNAPSCPPELITLLRNYGFPGNIRELKAMIFDAVGCAGKNSTLSCAPFSKSIRSNRQEVSEMPEDPQDWLRKLPELPDIEQTTNMLIKEALRRTNNNVTQAALLLGMSRPGLTKRIKRLNSE